MILLDENVIESQRALLRSWHIPARHIGYDMGRKGMKDDEVLAFLRGLRGTTFFTSDLRFFFGRELCHRRYCLVSMDVSDYDAAAFVRRILRHPGLDTQARRAGSVIAASQTGLRIWRPHAPEVVSLPWVSP